jgi:TolB protein
MNPAFLNSPLPMLEEKNFLWVQPFKSSFTSRLGLHKSYLERLAAWSRWSLLLLGVVMASWLPVNSFAQLRVEVTGLGVTLIPLNMNGFRDEASASQKISSIVQADLERAGQFKLTNSVLSMDETSRPEFSVLRERGMENFVSGSVTKLADGRYDVRFRLWDLLKAQDLGGASYAVSSSDLRRSAHQISDYIYEKLTGVKGIFSTRIAYVTKVKGSFHLWIADADGENAQAALTSPEPIISPSWSPDGLQLAYVSFETRKPVVYVHDVASGKRHVVANFKGSNSAPSWAPDGKSLAVTLSRDGGSQIFSVPVAGGEATRLTSSSGIDTEPTFTPDGSAIYFVSDRAGSPQIYRMPAKGGPTQRVTFTGNYNISPALSPDGNTLAYISRQGGQFKLYVMNLNTEKAQPLSDTSFDERPSFSPNGKLIIYATQLQGREALMMVNPDNKISSRLSGKEGDIREPHWGPYAKLN